MISGTIIKMNKKKTNSIDNNVSKAHTAFGSLNFPMLILFNLLTRGIPNKDRNVAINI